MAAQASQLCCSLQRLICLFFFSLYFLMMWHSRHVQGRVAWHYYNTASGNACAYGLQQPCTMSGACAMAACLEDVNIRMRCSPDTLSVCSVMCIYAASHMPLQLHTRSLSHHWPASGWRMGLRQGSMCLRQLQHGQRKHARECRVAVRPPASLTAVWAVAPHIEVARELSMRALFTCQPSQSRLQARIRTWYLHRMRIC